jgi:hypothetical protein
VKAQARLARMFKEAGFTLLRHTNHMIWGCPCGHTQIVCPGTIGGGGRAWENCESLMRRTLRACEAQRLEECA